MNYPRLARFIAAFLSSILLLSGCVTSALLDRPEKGYHDSFSSVLVSADEKTLVVITPEYHYVFAAPVQLVGVLKSPIHDAVTAKLNSFVLSGGNSITGYLELCLPRTSEAVVIAAAKKIGFGGERQNSDYCSSSRLKGVRYAAGKLAVSDSYKLHKTYDVYVKVEPGALDKGTRLALTPVTLAVDGTLIIAGSPLILTYIILLLNSDAPSH